ncbi:MAG: hypothetical protein C5B51_19490 [Terriglobia bacterium]|nr:MAG: hypothetical protein C5B51_19490 [Terriglobia bacterium]
MRLFPWTAKSELSSYNRSAERVFGYAAGEILGKPLDILLPSPFALHHDGTPVVELAGSP